MHYDKSKTQWIDSNFYFLFLKLCHIIVCTLIDFLSHFFLWCRNFFVVAVSHTVQSFHLSNFLLTAPFELAISFLYSMPFTERFLQSFNCVTFVLDLLKSTCIFNWFDSFLLFCDGCIRFYLLFYVCFFFL